MFDFPHQYIYSVNMSTPRPKPTKPRSLTREKLVTKAIELANKDGFAQLSMRRLASALGVTAMSLYNHVRNKDALLDLMLNEVVSSYHRPEIGSAWEPEMRRRAHSMRHALLANRWASTLLISRIAIGEAVLHDHNATVGCLVTAGLTYAQADWARNAIDNHVFGFTVQELNYPVDPSAYKAAAAQYLPMIPKADYPFMYEAAKQIIDGAYDGIVEFEFGLELILDGLKRWISTTP